MSKFGLVLGLGIVLAISAVASGAWADKLQNITCEQFLAMDEANQDDIVYWVHGVQTSSSKKEVEAEDIEVGFDAFGRPVAEVVNACKAEPKASLWSKIKKHF